MFLSTDQNIVDYYMPDFEGNLLKPNILVCRMAAIPYNLVNMNKRLAHLQHGNSNKGHNWKVRKDF